MSRIYGEQEIPWERDGPLRRLIFVQMEQMMTTKAMYDQDFPQHFKAISWSELWHMARRKVIEQVCNPCTAEDTGTEML